MRFLRTTRLVLLWLAASAAAACTTPGTPPEEVRAEEIVAPIVEDAVDEETIEAPVDPALEEAVAVIEPPGYCEQLLETLQATQPLLEGLGDSLDGHAARIETLVAGLEQPSAPRRPFECLDNGDSQLGSKEVIGAIEWIYMNPPGTHYRARIDSGAETSSLSAKDVVEFERDGDDWVRFTFEHETAEDAVEIEQPIVRTIIVRQPGMDGTDRRAVVELDIRLGDRLQRTEFALTDRSRMTYPVLLGRTFVRDLYVIDVARSYTHPRSGAP